MPIPNRFGIWYFYQIPANLPNSLLRIDFCATFVVALGVRLDLDVLLDVVVEVLLGVRRTRHGAVAAEATCSRMGPSDGSATPVPGSYPYYFLKNYHATRNLATLRLRMTVRRKKKILIQKPYAGAYDFQKKTLYFWMLIILSE